MITIVVYVMNNYKTGCEAIVIYQLTISSRDHEFLFCILLSQSKIHQNLLSASDAICVVLFHSFLIDLRPVIWNIYGIFLSTKASLRLYILT